jgi:hypothetical protein
MCDPGTIEHGPRHTWASRLTLRVWTPDASDARSRDGASRACQVRGGVAEPVEGVRGRVAALGMWSECTDVSSLDAGKHKEIIASLP